MSHWYDSTPKKSRRKRDSNPGPSALEADALTARPTRRSSNKDRERAGAWCWSLKEHCRGINHLVFIPTRTAQPQPPNSPSPPPPHSTPSLSILFFRSILSQPSLFLLLSVNSLSLSLPSLSSTPPYLPLPTPPPPTARKTSKRVKGTQDGG